MYAKNWSVIDHLTCLTWVDCNSAVWRIFVPTFLSDVCDRNVSFKIHKICCVNIYHQNKGCKNHKHNGRCVQLFKMKENKILNSWALILSCNINASHINNIHIYWLYYLKYGFSVKSHHVQKFWMYKQAICQPMSIDTKSDKKCYHNDQGCTIKNISLCHFWGNIVPIKQDLGHKHHWKWNTTTF